MKYSVMVYPHHPVAESVEIAQVCDELDFYACYYTDSAFRRDLWQIMTLAADRTTKVRLGPNAVRLLTDPMQIARALATLDEISGGRVDALACLSDPRYHSVAQSAQKVRAVPFVREMFEVLRLATKEQRFSFDGEYFRCEYNAYPTKTQTIQQPFPLKYASSGGPKLLQLAGEVADGAHIAPHYTRAVVDYVIENVKIGADKAGRDWRELDIAVCPIFCVSEDGDLARKVAAAHATFYIAWQPERLWDILLPEAGVDRSVVTAITDAWKADDLPKAASLVSPELAAALSIAGTPEECAAQLNEKFVGGPVDHLVLMAVDASHSDLVWGDEFTAPEGVPSITEQLRTFHGQVLPKLNL